jgi:hypothetical protein
VSYLDPDKSEVALNNDGCLVLLDVLRLLNEGSFGQGNGQVVQLTHLVVCQFAFGLGFVAIHHFYFVLLTVVHLLSLGVDVCKFDSVDLEPLDSLHAGVSSQRGGLLTNFVDSKHRLGAAGIHFLFLLAALA